MTPEEVEIRALGRLVQHLSRKKWHIAVSLTKNCPLACRHCIVKANKGTYDRSAQTAEISEWLAAGLTRYQEKISDITFTGGESPLADIAFKKVGMAAESVGIPCGLITSAYFAKSEHAATEFFKSHSFIKSLTTSFDEYHEEFLPISFPINALRAAKKLGLRVSARHSGELNGPYYNKLKRLLEADFGDILENQDLVFGGRAEDLPQGSDPTTALSQCPSDGPHIGADGNILPCCSTIISRDTNDALSLGNVRETSFGEMLDSLDAQPLLQIIRTWGWDHVIDNLPYLRKAHAGVEKCGGCTQCAVITHHPQSAALVKTWSENSPHAQQSTALAIAYITKIRSTPKELLKQEFGLFK